MKKNSKEKTDEFLSVLFLETNDDKTLFFLSFARPTDFRRAKTNRNSFLIIFHFRTEKNQKNADRSTEFIEFSFPADEKLTSLREGHPTNRKSEIRRHLVFLFSQSFSTELGRTNK